MFIGVQIRNKWRFTFSSENMFTNEQDALQWDWDELKTVLVVAETGTLSAAARLLGTSHPTVYRRIRDLEQRLGAELFEKSGSGYRPTAAGDHVVQAAERMSAQLLSLNTRLGAGPQALTGTLRITCSDTVYIYVLLPLLAQFRHKHPDVQYDVTVSNDFINLHKQDFDVAFRSSRRSSQNLFGLKLCDLMLGIHGHRDNPAVHDAPLRLAEHDWVGFDETMTMTLLSSFMREHDLERKVTFRVNSLSGACDAVKHNLGLAMLPFYVGTAVEEIVPLNAPDAVVRSELWMISTQAAQRRSLVRALFDFFKAKQGEIQSAASVPGTHVPGAARP